MRKKRNEAIKKSRRRRRGKTQISGRKHRFARPRSKLRKKRNTQIRRWG